MKIRLWLHEYPQLEATIKNSDEIRKAVSSKLIEEPDAEYLRRLDYTIMKVRIINNLLPILNHRQRQVIEMFFFKRLTITQIAKMLGCSEETVKSNKRAALKLLEENLKKINITD